MARTVGIRDLRSNLRAYLAHVKSGEDIVVTERGVPIARIAAAGGEDPLERLIAEGRARRPVASRRPIRLDELVPLRGGATIADLVAQQHGH